VVLGVDVGGTFTDAVLATPDGLVTAKAPTTPDDQSAGVLDAVRAALRRAHAHAEDVERFVHGMTVGTNALLEGKVARTALLATEGFTDIEELGRQARAELYRLCAGHPPPLVPPELRVAVPERCGPDGVLEELDREELRRRIDNAPGFEAAAVCLLWGFRHPAHERACGAALDSDIHVSLSNEAAGVFREYERCATTVVDAALSPLLRRYLERLAARAVEAGLPEPEIMLSGGGVAPAAVAAKHGSWTVLSGPAGGAVGGASTGAPEAVCLDMGGTSSDVSVVSGGRARQSGGRTVAGRALAIPMVDVHTVGAGGGSIAWADDGGALRVGPQSAGAWPGPACYGNGGDNATVTDANLLLGNLDPAFPLAGGINLDERAAADAIARLAGQLGLDVIETAEGILRVANAEMAGAVRVMTVERGIDPRALTLVAFGGAGPMHGAAVADELGMRRVLVPPASSVLSALGMVASERRVDLVESVLLTGDALTGAAVSDAIDRLAEAARSQLATEGEVRAAFDVRYVGQAFELTVRSDSEPDAIRSAFDNAHEERYGFKDPDAEIELVTIRVSYAQSGSPLPREEPEAREEVSGPALRRALETTVVIPEGWIAWVDGDGAWVLERNE
jgi:N-methylhydantoinase A/oxoprolinase/acetone carboxylase beta subunit